MNCRDAVPSKIKLCICKMMKPLSIFPQKLPLISSASVSSIQKFPEKTHFEKSCPFLTSVIAVCDPLHIDEWMSLFFNQPRLQPIGWYESNLQGSLIINLTNPRVEPDASFT
ncbi:hypothetical protein CDAR_313881 [Caerostris darwini]|uniref:Uncharacterized protein n=1 Tax=Caerostris darwini TaxID=1538125 RepID=A0AAV4QGA6_9ARAC|nr:hypothetical protein CDAR_313881 [Caerostris darwini]